MKDGTHEDRLVLAIKAVKPLIGAPRMLAGVIAAEAEGLSAAGWSGGPLDGLGGVGELVNLSTAGGLGGTGATNVVPGLAMDKVGRGSNW